MMRYTLSDRNRYLLSYLAVFVLPLVLLLAGGYYWVRWFIVQDALQSNRMDLQYAIQRVDKEITTIRHAAALLSEDPNFYTYYLAPNTGAFYDVCTALGKQRFANNTVDDLFYFNKTTGRIYGPDGVYRPELFFRLHPYKNQERLWQLLQENHRGPQLVGETPDQAGGRIAYLYPLEMDALGVESYLCFTMSPSALQIPPTLLEGGLSLFITAGQEVCFVSDLPSLQALGPELPALQAGETGTRLPYRFNRYEGIHVQGLSALSNAYLTNKLAPMRMVFIAIVLLMAPLGAVLISSSMKISFHPLTELFRLAKSVLPSSKDAAPTDSIQSVQHVLVNLAEQNSEMLQLNQLLGRERLLFQLIRGENCQSETLPEELRAANLVFPGEAFRTIILELENNYLYNLEAIYTILGEQLDFAAVYPLEYLEDNRIILLYCAPQQLDEKLFDRLTQISALVYRQMTLEVVWGVGDLFGGIDGYKTSYMHARDALKYKLLRSDTVYLYRSGDTSKKTFCYPHNELQTFYNAILSMDTNRMRLSLNAITEQIEQAPTLFIGTSLFYDILNTAIKATFELDHHFVNIFDALPELTSKPEIHSSSEILELVDAIMRLLINNVEKTVSPSHPVDRVSIEGIYLYINENFSDPNFSLQLLASHFGMSMSNFSHYFKSRTSMSLLDYLTGKKIAKTKELLLNTDDTLNEIVQKMGYMHPSNFIKKFKSIVGMTPGRFRELYRIREAVPIENSPE